MTFDEWIYNSDYDDIKTITLGEVWEAATRYEREECAKECEKLRSGFDNRTMQAEGWAVQECIDKIRQITK